VTLACSKSRPTGTEGASATAVTGCTRCHGGVDNGTGAPPFDLAHRSDPTLRSVGAHSAHVTAGPLAGAIDCGECHVKPTSPETHQQPGGSKLRWGSLATGAVATGQTTTSPTFDGTRCSSTYCHGATLNAGGSNHAPVWTGGQGEAACGTCHAVPPPFPHVATSDLTHCTVCHPQTMDATGAIIPASKGGKHIDGILQAAGHDVSWMDTTSPNFHAFAADGDLASCTRCHGAQLDGGTANVACTQCHVQGGTANAFGCTMCHGGTDNTTGAPPAATWGHAGDPQRGGGTLDPIRVGAHTAHVTASPISPALDCSVCHVKPTEALSPGHVDGTPTVTFAGLALTQGANPTWNVSAATCSSTYCHGAFDGGNHAAPVWTGGSGEATCGSCHGTPPPAPHPTAAMTDCAGCHPDTMNADGTVIPPAQGGKHLDGIVEAHGHPASWMDQASPGFHAFSADADITKCQGCHGQDLSGGSTKLACASCHSASGVANAFTCTGCHGGGANQTGAPPRGIWGAQTDPVAIGAHTAHVTASPISQAFDCNVCHVKPTDALSPGHVDGNPTVTFAGLALSQGANPTWNVSATTCSNTYCHGAFNGGNRATPVWTGGSSEGACGTCHDTPPAAPHPQNTNCGSCHGAGYSLTSVDTTKHVNGMVDLGAMSCTSCHGNSALAASPASPLAAAPPVDTTGSSSPSSPGVGAHQAHLNDGPLRVAMVCTDCHVVPADLTSHPTGTVVFGWSALAKNQGANPTFDGTRCSSTYCHGATLNHGGSNQQPAWTGGAAEAACGTCHGVPPPSPHPQNTSCGSCHGSGYSQTTVDKTKHVNGQLDVGAMSCTSCHGNPAQTATPANPLFAAPPVDTHGNATSAQVGAHQTHLNGSALAPALACTSCHTVPADLTSHPSGTVNLTWSALARGAVTSTDVRFASTGPSSPQWNGTAGTCSSTYCHGNYSGTFTYIIPDGTGENSASVPFSGATATPSWSTPGVGCTSCHGLPPNTYTWHNGHPGGAGCDVCHPGVNSAGTAFSDTSKHVDGVIELKPLSTRCIGCH
jgi:predicted CxxxxCH...CXXCH cytochrome family protein